MSKLWLNNELVDRVAMLQKTETEHPGINQVAIEKDWWVTATLKALFQTDCHESLIFKGGTSLSKGFNIIERFSEDIDLAISHTFFGVEKTNKNQRDKLRKAARKYIHESLSVQLDAQMKAMGVTGYTIENVTQVKGKDGEWRPIDSDKDGIADWQDQCPGTFTGAIVNNDGCPINPRHNLNAISQRIRFKGNDTTFYNSSYTALNDIIQMMREHPTMTLEIECSASDSEHGTALQHSTARAETIYNYLEMKGIHKDRLKFSGTGNKLPAIKIQRTGESETIRLTASIQEVPASPKK
jgi:outer membrane protein OmpA-like peptidoglycan-associated protein